MVATPVVRVEDEELGIEADLYLESVTFSSDPEVTAELVLMRPNDLVFAEELYPGASGSP